MDAIIVLALLGALIVLLVLERPRADVAAMLVLAVLILSGILEPAEAFSGFSHPATVAVASMFLLSAGLQASGIVRWIGDSILRAGPVPGTLAVAGAGLLIGPVSAFLNNTAAVAVFLPIVVQACRAYGLSPSRVMMPLSFFAMLGGTCTLIGTSTNIVVSSVAAEHGLRPFGMFELTPVGLALFAGCGVFLLVASRRLLPDRIPAESLAEDYHLRPFLSEVIVQEGSSLAGQTLGEARLGERHDLEVLGIYRGAEKRELPGPETALREGDTLIVKVSASALVKLRGTAGLTPRHGNHPEGAALGTSGSTLVEVLVPANSRLEGRTLKQVDFRRRYGAVALAVRHHGADLVEKVGKLRLALGDEMLLLARPADLERLRRQRDFVVLQELDLQLLRPVPVLTSLLIVAGVVGAAASGLLSIAEAAVVGSVAMVLTRCLPLRRVYESIDWRVIVLLAGLIPMGTALERSGAAHRIVEALFWLVGDLGPTAVLSALFLLTLLLTGFMSNNAAAALLAPVALAVAATLGADARPFLVAVAFAASGAFYTPVGYQTNLLVFGPGGYRFTDFLRLGGPLVLLYWGLATLLIPRIFPF